MANAPTVATDPSGMMAINGYAQKLGRIAAPLTRGWSVARTTVSVGKDLLHVTSRAVNAAGTVALSTFWAAAKVLEWLALRAAVAGAGGAAAALGLKAHYDLERSGLSRRETEVTVEGKQEEPADCRIISGSLVTQSINAPPLMTLVGAGFPDIVLPGGIKSQVDPLVPGPVNNPSGGLPAEYRHSLMVVWTGNNLDKCTFHRSVDSTSSSATWQPNMKTSGRGYNQTGKADETLSAPDDLALNYGRYTFRSKTLAIQSDAPGFVAWHRSQFPVSYGGNFIAYAKDSTGKVVGRIWYDVRIAANMLNDPNPTNYAVETGVQIGP